MRRYKMTFEFLDTELQAKQFCDKQNQNKYIKQKHPAHYTPWSSSNGNENKFVAWYATK